LRLKRKIYLFERLKKSFEGDIMRRGVIDAI
jgi:hypothetical protein